MYIKLRSMMDRVPTQDGYFGEGAERGEGQIRMRWGSWEKGRSILFHCFEYRPGSQLARQQTPLAWPGPGPNPSDIG
jgi:hypothetical protein